MNNLRGETVTKLGGQDWTLRPTFEAMVEFEERAGITAIDLITSLPSRQPDGSLRGRVPSIKAIAAGFWAGIRAGLRPGQQEPTFAQVGAWIMDRGINECAHDLVTFLTRGLTKASDLAEAEQGKAATATGAPS